MPEPTTEPASTEVSQAARDRLHQRYARMEGRGVVIHFSPLGLTFNAKADDVIPFELKHEPEN